MKNGSWKRGVLALLMGSVPFSASAQMPAASWQPTEEIKTYAIDGQTGAQLYASMGDRGPALAGGSRAIAHTSFKLTWTRKYEPKDGGCTITVAKPKLIITYTLPKPSTKLPPALSASWSRFIRGVEAHERVHGGYIKDLVHQIEAVSLGMAVPNDPSCQKIRAQLTEKLGALSRAERQKNADFDRVEMSDGGNIHQLILALVNGP